jgi:hypothetical protein
MTRTQIQLPDELYRRAKAASEEYELSLAEMTRRGLEMFLERIPKKRPEKGSWKLPTFNGSGLKVPLADLHNISADEETFRSLPR